MLNFFAGSEILACDIQVNAGVAALRKVNAQGAVALAALYEIAQLFAIVNFKVAQAFGPAKGGFKTSVINGTSFPGQCAPGVFGTGAGKGGHTSWHAYSGSVLQSLPILANTGGNSRD